VKILVRTAAAVTAAAALLLAPTAAFATVATPATLAEAQADVTKKIDDRLATLTKLTTAVTANTTVSAAHKATLLALYTADTAGLTALKAKVATETTLEQVKADRSAMILDYRIYLVVVPQTQIVLKADFLAAVAAGTATASTKAMKKTNAGADRWLKRTAVDLTKAAAQAAAAADAALAVTPANMLKDGKSFATARAHLEAARQYLGLGRGHLLKAHQADRRHEKNCPKLTTVPTVPTISVPTVEAA
jgi:hypothetical protein